MINEALRASARALAEAIERACAGGGDEAETVAAAVQMTDSLASDAKTLSKALARRPIQRKPDRAETWLACGIADYCGCRAILRMPSAMYGPGVSHWQFVGLSPATEVAAYLCERLERARLAARRQQVAAAPRGLSTAARSTRGDAFSRDWVRAVLRLLPPAAADAARDALIDADLAGRDVQQLEATGRRAVRGGGFEALDGIAGGQRPPTRHGVIPAAPKKPGAA